MSAKFAGFHGDGTNQINQGLQADSPQITFNPPVSGVFLCVAQQYDMHTNWMVGPPAGFDADNSAYFSAFISEVNGQKFEENSPGKGCTVSLSNVHSITATIKYKNCSVRGTLIGPL